MSLEKISGASVYYLEGAEVHGDIVTPVRGDLAIYTYAPTGGFIGQEYSHSGSAWFERTQIKASSADDVVNGVSISDIGPITQPHNRNRSSVNATREKVTWTESENIREITITVTDNGTGIPDGEELAAFCFNAGTDAIADAWLTETDSESDDVQYEVVSPAKEKTLRFTSPLTRLDMKRIDGDASLRIHIGGH